MCLYMYECVLLERWGVCFVLRFPRDIFFLLLTYQFCQIIGNLFRKPFLERINLFFKKMV